VDTEDTVAVPWEDLDSLALLVAWEVSLDTVRPLVTPLERPLADLEVDLAVDLEAGLEVDSEEVLLEEDTLVLWEALVGLSEDLAVRVDHLLVV
jgi:hypothetical protein